MSIAVAAALLVGACGAGNSSAASGGNGLQPSSAAGAREDPLAPVEVSLNVEGGACRAAINGIPADSERLLYGAVAALQDSIEAQERRFGAVNALPPLLLRAGPDIPWRCVGGAIHQVRRGGFSQLLFQSSDASPIIFDLPVPDETGVRPQSPVTNTITIEAGGSFRFNAAPVTPERLSEQLRLTAGMSEAPALVINPEGNVRYDTVFALLARVRAAGVGLSVNESTVGMPTVDFAATERFAADLK